MENNPPPGQGASFGPLKVIILLLQLSHIPTRGNDQETFLKAKEHKVKCQFLVGRTCATCP